MRVQNLNFLKSKKKITFFLVVSFLITLLMVVVSGCSSSSPSKRTEVENKNIQKDFEVRDASDTIRPGWIADAMDWGKEQKESDQYRFFAFETTPKVDRETACDLAKTNARADIASEIATFIEKQIGSSKEGSASIDPNNPDTRGLREFIEVTLAEKTKALIHGAQVFKTYWEKRQYLQSKGAKRDYIGYTCAALIRIERERVKQAVEEAANHVLKKVDDPQTKDNVKKALKDVSENFDKAKQGLI
ncbi:MAG: hypothetical protein HQK51_16675 [Oligoflexia bacterium]|nr:hypothetical protein [Oligoflexia bacterium]